MYIVYMYADSEVFIFVSTYIYIFFCFNTDMQQLCRNQQVAKPAFY